jgi:rSAM/selenodomain-associated transferase 2
VNVLTGKRWITWPRLLALAITGALLFFIFRQLPLRELQESLRHLQPGWFILAALTYGAALGLAGLRSHIAYRLTDRAVHATASCRAFFAGHFFFVALFGAAGGDIAKSAVYARWYRFPMAEVLAAAPLDRVIGFCGTTMLAIIMVVVVAANDGFAVLKNLDVGFSANWLWLGGALAVATVALLLFWAPKGEAAWKRTVRTFQSGTLRLFQSPVLTTRGLFAAFLAQTGLSAVFALNLAAVTQENLYWGQIAWTFPAITLISCMPFTVAGAGVREAAALALLGLYQVPPGDCVAAALLTLVLKLVWAAVGAIVLWREELLFARRGHYPLPQSVSVVIPTLNEALNLPETVRLIRCSPEVSEIIVADGGSSDETCQIAEQLGCRVITSRAGRGGQLRLGAAAATGDVILLLHADTSVPPQAGHAVLNCLRDAAVVAGGFWKVFRSPMPLLLGSKVKCGIRLLIGRRIAGDQGLFIRREILEAVGGVPDQPLMEEFELCRRLRRLGRLALADATVVTSDRRFRKLGVCRTYLRMWWVTMLYRFGVPPQRLRQIYERD